MKTKALLILTLVPLAIIILALTANDKNLRVGNPYEKAEEITKVTDKQSVIPPKVKLDITKRYRVILKTTEGDITIKVNPLDAIMASTNFVYLSKIGFYDNTIFHRVIKDFMIQGGDPLGNGTGGPGYTFNDEPIEGEYVRGTVAMANSGPNTNGSQFFIIVKDSPDLPKNYTIFGKVIDGMDVVDKIAAGEVTDNGAGEISKPVSPVSITGTEVIEELNVSFNQRLCSFAYKHCLNYSRIHYLSNIQKPNPNFYTDNFGLFFLGYFIFTVAIYIAKTFQKNNN
jgi:cyclophilin family peptidyl-prolyl cis-trans isomerase